MAEVHFRTADGFELRGVLYEAARPRTPRRAVILHGGAGLGALRYRPFAQFLAESGIPVLTYDYRGVGLSEPAELRGFPASVLDWVEYDSAAAIAWLRSRFPEHELIGVSHSIGALALAGAPNAAHQAHLVFIAPHTGYWGDYRLAYRLPMMLMWHVLMPLVTRLAGYFPGRRLHLCDDLPAGIALEWARRRSPGLYSTGVAAQRAQRLLEHARALERPATVIVISDDAFATSKGAKRLLSYFPGLRSQQVILTPSAANMAHLGHFGIFRRAAGAALWPRLLTLIEGN